MSLNKAQLKQDLVDMMKRGVDEKWDADQSAQALADSIDKFVRTGVVDGITVRAVDGKLMQEHEVSVR
jgi:hypothetical protein